MASGLRRRLSIAPAVEAALAAGRSVVALESTLISHGLPYPDNLEVARASEAAVRSAGAEPATVAVRDGRLLVGLDDDSLRALATAEPGSVRKVARPSLAAGLAVGGWAATTVSATMLAAHAAGIDVLATGGIGGVHRGSFDGPRPSLDISADLDELARTPVAVVCAGPKAILDIARTLEYLKTRGVPVVTIGQAGLPGFYSRKSGFASPSWVPDEASVVGVVRTQLDLGLGAGSSSARRSPRRWPSRRRRSPRRSSAHCTRPKRRCRRAGAYALAPRPPCRADRRRLGPDEHGADSPRCRGRRPLAVGLVAASA